ncbi:hypothetical protein EDD27_9340 [Nonomuraea polychroma]|uniref:Uncharacterized protein n=1 Tax=Nonomuraea polychroma TaxID=46176 RepID=A0A438MLI7_9ACTN|nr:hypothetical protein [Nonomuraea polychroma]RVX46455.1 hypothetical protein EDD27_9340 [Nonomuraea polychroma]
MTRKERVRWATLIGVPFFAAMWVVVLGAMRWPRYWEWLAPEQTPMTWLESVMLVLCAGVALLMAAVIYLRDQPAARLWLLLAAGFVWLALDERFAVHERVRDGYLAPSGVSPIPWGAPGDFILILYGIAGLALLPQVLRLFRPDRLAFVLFGAGVLLAVVAVASDSIDIHAHSIDVERVEQTAEEIAELASFTCFLLAMTLRLLAILTDGTVRLPRVGDVSQASMTGK